MAFELIRFIGAGEGEANEENDAAAESITKGECLYWASGYLGRVYSSVTCALLAGIAMQTVDNSGGSAGDKTCLFQASPLAVYKVGTADTMTKAYRGYNCALASATTITSASAGTDITGVFKILGYVSTSKCTGRLNFSSEADT